MPRLPAHPLVAGRSIPQASQGCLLRVQASPHPGRLRRLLFQRLECSALSANQVSLPRFRFRQGVLPPKVERRRLRLNQALVLLVTLTTRGPLLRRFHHQAAIDQLLLLVRSRHRTIPARFLCREFAANLVVHRSPIRPTSLSLGLVRPLFQSLSLIFLPPRQRLPTVASLAVLQQVQILPLSQKI